MNVAYAILDGPLTAIVRARPETLTPLTASGPAGRALLAFSSVDAAAAHLAALPDEVAASHRSWTADADDWRAKEELLRAAASLGARRLELDPDLDLRPAAQLPLERAIAYVTSYKRSRACL